MFKLLTLRVILLVAFCAQIKCVDWSPQTSYKVKLDRVELDTFDRSVIRDVRFKSFKLNRKEFGFNLTQEWLTPVYQTNNTITHVMVYRRTGSDYRLKLVQFQLHYCDFVKRKFFGVMELRHSNGTVLAGCPIVPDRYSTYNTRFGDDRLPANVPSGSYRLQVAVRQDKVDILSLSFYAEIINNKKF